MNNEDSNGASRRQFLQRGAQGAWTLGVGGALGLISAEKLAAKPASPLGQEFTYDISRLRKVDPALIHYQPSGTIAHGLKDPRYVICGADDIIRVAGGKEVVSCGKDGSVVTNRIALDDEVHCLTASADGTLYAGYKNQIVVFDSKGQKTAWNKLDASTLLTSLAVTEGHLFAADAANRIVLHFDASGKELGRLGKVPGKKNSHFVVPSPYFDLAIGPGNLLWVVNPGEHLLEAYTFEGEKETAWGQFSSGIEGFCGCCNPVHFALLSDGRFVTAEKGLPRVKVYSGKGEFECVVAEPDQFPKLIEGVKLLDAGLDVAVDAQDRVLVADPLAGQVRIYTVKK